MQQRTRSRRMWLIFVAALAVPRIRKPERIPLTNGAVSLGRGMCRARSALALGAMSGLIALLSPVRAEASFASDVCQVIDNLPPICAGTFCLEGTCGFGDYDNLYYYGSRGFIFPTGSALHPEAHRAALYCALAESEGRSAAARISALGGFGAETIFNVYNRTLTPLRVAGQRIGRLTAFGFTADVEAETFDYRFPTEGQTVTIQTPFGPLRVPFTGFYSNVQASRYAWEITGSGTLATVPPITVTVTFAQGGADELSYNQNVWDLRLSPSAPFRNEPPLEALYDTRLAQCNACVCVPGSLCPCRLFWCPTSQEIARHNLGDLDYRNLTDGLLPYRGARGGSRGTFVYRDNAANNWFHYGSPGPGLLGLVGGTRLGGGDLESPLDEPTTRLELRAGVSFEAAIASVAFSLSLTFDWKTGIAVREEFQPPLDVGSREELAVWTSLDSSIKVLITARIVVDLDLPFVDNPIIDETFNILPAAENAEATTPALISYAISSPFPFGTYQVDRTNREPALALAGCIFKPPVDEEPQQPANPVDFLANVSLRGLQNVHPCKVRICDAAGRFTSCEWEPNLLRLVCTQDVEGPCTCKDNTASVCDSDGRVFPAVPQGGKCL